MFYLSTKILAIEGGRDMEVYDEVYTVRYYSITDEKGGGV